MSTLREIGVAAKAFVNNLLAQAQDLFDSFFPPEQRTAFIAKLKAWASANPKFAVRDLPRLVLLL